MAHICVGKLTIIGSDNGLSPSRRQAIIWTNAGILLIGHLRTTFSEILIEIHTFSFKKIDFKMESGNWRPSCLGLNVLIFTLMNFYFYDKGWEGWERRGVWVIPMINTRTVTIVSPATWSSTFPWCIVRLRILTILLWLGQIWNQLLHSDIMPRFAFVFGQASTTFYVPSFSYVIKIIFLLVYHAIDIHSTFFRVNAGYLTCVTYIATLYKSSYKWRWIYPQVK